MQKVSFKMIACIINISGFGMVLAVLLMGRSLPMDAVFLTALNVAATPFLYMSELKELKKKLFDRDDDFRGGSFT